MKLPEALKVGALTYRIVLDPDLAAEDGQFGVCNHRKLEIRIDSGAGHERQQKTLLHEALEAINYEYFIQLNHDQMEQLEGALSALLYQNPGVF